MKIEHVYVDKDGVICAVIGEMPEAPKRINLCRVTCGQWLCACHLYVDQENEYNSAIESIKSSAVQFEDQKEAELEVFKEWFAQSDEDDSWEGLKPDTFYPLCCEVDIFEKAIDHSMEYSNGYGIQYGSKIKLARLITDSNNEPVEEESQYQEIWNAVGLYNPVDFKKYMKEKFHITRKEK